LRLLKALNLSTNEIHRLTELPAQTLLDLQITGEGRKGPLSIPADANKIITPTGAEHDYPGQFAPLVDGHIVPAHPFDPVATPLAAKIPLMIGFNHQEAMFIFREKPEVFNMTKEQLVERGRERFGDNAQRIADVYRKAMPDASPSDIFIAIATATTFGNDTFALAALKSAQPPAVFLYRYDYESNVPIKGTNTTLKACHASDIAPTFYNYDQVGLHGNGPGLPDASRNLSALWTSFARTGKPSARGAPEWPRYNTKSRPTMLIDTTCKVVNDPDAEIRKMWETL